MKMKIKNKYVFRIIISEFLYFFLKKNHMGLTCLLGLGAWVISDLSTGLAWLSYPDTWFWLFS